LVISGCGGAAVVQGAANVQAPTASASPSATATASSPPPKDEPCVRWAAEYASGTRRVYGWQLDGAGRIAVYRDAWRFSKSEEQGGVALSDPSDAKTTFVWGDDGRLSETRTDEHTASGVTHHGAIAFHYGEHGELASTDRTDTLLGPEHTSFDYEGTFTPPAVREPVVQAAFELHFPRGPVPLPRVMGELQSAMGKGFFFSGKVHVKLTLGANLEGTDEYDAAGRLVRSTFGKNPAQAYRYDASGQLVEQSGDDGALATFTWEAGHITKVVHQRGGAVVSETVVTYDANGRATQRESTGTSGRTVDTASYSCEDATHDPFVP
jgi:YD repeat-containing protein